MRTANSSENPLIALLDGMPAPRQRLTDYRTDYARPRGSAEAAVEGERPTTYEVLESEVGRFATLLAS